MSSTKSFDFFKIRYKQLCMEEGKKKKKPLFQVFRFCEILYVNFIQTRIKSRNFLYKGCL
jgi:hypothetical protein